MTQVTANFETGVSGNTISTGDTGDATAWNTISIGSGNAITYDTAHVADGTLAAKFAMSNSAAGYLEWSAAMGTLTDHYGRLYMYLTANPTVNQLPFLIYQQTSSRCVRFDINTDGTIRFFDNPATGLVTTTNAIALNQFVRLEWHVVHSATVGQVELKLFNTASSTSPTETLTSPANWNTLTNTNDARFGLVATHGAAQTYWIDNIVAGATSYPGPVTSLVTFIPKPVPPVLRW